MLDIQLSEKPSYDPWKRSQETKAKLTCYEGPNQQGSSVVLEDYAPVLDNYNFNNRAASCCFNGM